MVRPLPLPAPASGLVTLLERAAERFGEEYFRVRLGNWYFLGGARYGGDWITAYGPVCDAACEGRLEEVTHG
jgi:hypothetical protein